MKFHVLMAKIRFVIVRRFRLKNDIDHNEAKDKFTLFVQYHGKVTDELAQKLHQCPMSHSYDIKKTENYDALFETPCDDHDENQRRVSNYITTL